MDIKDIITQLEERLSLAQLTSDIGELSDLIDDNIVFAGLDGSILNKQDDLNLHKSDKFKITKMELIERKIQAYENTVVVNTLMDTCAVFGNDSQCDKIRYIRVWHKLPDGWRIISGSMHVESE